MEYIYILKTPDGYPYTDRISIPTITSTRKFFLCVFSFLPRSESANEARKVEGPHYNYLFRS
jgi:hypothetical protein